MLFIFNRNDELIEILKEEDFSEDEYKTQINGEWSYTFEINKLRKSIKKGNKVGLYDEDNNFQLLVIDDTEELYSIGEKYKTRVYSIHDFYHLRHKVIEDKRILKGSAQQALTKCLEGTSYLVGEVAELGLNNINFYYISSLEALNSIIKTYGGELNFRLELNEQKTKVSKRYVDIKYRLGEDTGLRFTFDINLDEVRKKEYGEFYNVLYGRGASLESGDGFSRKLTFESIGWEKPNNPANKPLGNKFLEDIEGIEKYGRREGIFESGDIKTPEELITKTWEKLKEVNKPKVTYTATAKDLSNILGYEHLKVVTGDTINILDDEYGINIEARIIEQRYSICKKDRKTIVLGNFLNGLTDDAGNNSLTDRLDKVESKPTDIDDSKYPNTLPEVPVVTARGGFATITLEWTYESKSYYSYEVYASKISNFNPDFSNLIFRGKSSSFLHEVKPKETWYYKIRAINTHNKATPMSNQVSASTLKLSDGAEYFEEAAIKDALIGTLNLDRGWVGRLSATHFDAKNLTVTDGNGEETLKINSFGEIYLKPKYFELTSSSETNVPTKDDVKNTINNVKKEIDKNIDDVQGTVDNLKGYTDGAFKDGLLTEDEKSKISGYINPLQTEMSDITEEYETIYKNIDLVNAFKTNLKTSYDNYKGNFDELINVIKATLKLTIVGVLDNDKINSKYKKHDTSLSVYRKRVNEAIDSIAKNKADKAEKNSNTKTEASIKIVNDSIKEKVSKVDYDKNNNVISNKLLEIDKTADGLKVEVSKKVGEEEVKQVIEATPESLMIGFNSISNNIEFSKEGMKIYHNNGSHTILSADGVMVHDGRTSTSYHSLSTTGQVRVQGAVKVQLPNRFKDKNFAIALSIAQTGLNIGAPRVNGLSSISANYSDIDNHNATFQIRASSTHAGANSIGAVDGYVDVHYTVIA